MAEGINYYELAERIISEIETDSPKLGNREKQELTKYLVFTQEVEKTIGYASELAKDGYELQNGTPNFNNGALYDIGLDISDFRDSQEWELRSNEEPIFGIYQLKDSHELKFMPYKLHTTVDKENYNLVYIGYLSEETTPEDIFYEFNNNHPANFVGHSLSVSDVCVFQRGGKVDARFVDSIGFVPLPDFITPNLTPGMAPVVNILLSDSGRLREKSQLTLHEANSIYYEIDNKQHHNNIENDSKDYIRTDFNIEYWFDGKACRSADRIDLGGGLGTLIDHIRQNSYYHLTEKFWLDHMQTEHPDELYAYVKHHAMVLDKLVPYLEAHCRLSTINDLLNDKIDEIKSEPKKDAINIGLIEYYKRLKDYVSDWRVVINADENYKKRPEIPNIYSCIQSTNLTKQESVKVAKAAMVGQKIHLQIVEFDPTRNKGVAQDNGIPASTRKVTSRTKGNLR